MIRFFILLLAILGLGWLVADSMKQFGPGYILVYFNHYSLETSIWVGALLLFALVLICYLLIVLLRSLFKLSSFTFSFRDRKQRQWFEQSVNAFLQEDLTKALKLASRNPQFLDLQLAVRIALQTQNIELAREYLKKAAKADDVDAFALMLLHYDIEVADQQNTAAQQVLTQLLQLQPKHPAVLGRAVTAYTKANQIQALTDLLPTLTKKVSGLLQDQQKQWLIQAGRCLIADAVKQNNQEQLKEIWFHVSKTAARNVVLPQYCQALIDLQQSKQAAKLLNERLNTVFDENCLVVYAQLDLPFSERLQLLQMFEKQHPMNAQLQLAIGVLYLQDEQWQKAHHALNQSIAIQPSTNAYRYLAEYYHLNGNEKLMLESLQRAMKD